MFFRVFWLAWVLASKSVRISPNRIASHLWLLNFCFQVTVWFGKSHLSKTILGKYRVLIMYRRFRDLWYTYTIKMVANQNLLFAQPLIKNNFVLSDCEWKDMRKTVMLSRL